MQSKLLTSLAVAFLLACVAGAGGSAAPDDKASLQGIWNAKSMEVDGKPAPAEAVKLMRFTFKGGKCFGQGQLSMTTVRKSAATRSMPQSLRSTSTSSPRRRNKSILGIYDIKGDELKLCLRHAGSSDGRP